MKQYPGMKSYTPREDMMVGQGNCAVPTSETSSLPTLRQDNLVKVSDQWGPVTPKP